MQTRVDELLNSIAQGGTAKQELHDILERRADEIFAAFTDVINEGEWGELKSPCGYLLADLSIRTDAQVWFAIAEGTTGDDRFCHRERSYFECYKFTFTVEKDESIKVLVITKELDCGTNPGPAGVIQALATKLGKELTYKEYVSLHHPLISDFSEASLRNSKSDWQVIKPAVTTAASPENISLPDVTRSGG